VVVTPRYAGNFGCIRIGGRERTPKEEFNLCYEIKNNIQRHIDDVEYVSINQKEVFVTSTDDEYDTLYKSLQSEYAPEEYYRSFSYEYKRPCDNGVKTTK
jgi:hypothetical protein